MRWIPHRGRALAGGVLLAVAASPAFAAPQAPNMTPLAAATQETARRIPVAEARQALAQGKAVLVDVRNKEAYDGSHAQGAISIPLADIGARAAELPKNKLIITYCTWASEHTSARAVLELQAKGFTQVACLLGGLDAWSKDGGKLVSGHP